MRFWTSGCKTPAQMPTRVPQADRQLSQANHLTKSGADANQLQYLLCNRRKLPKGGVEDLADPFELGRNSPKRPLVHSETRNGYQDPLPEVWSRHPSRNSGKDRNGSSPGQTHQCRLELHTVHVGRKHRATQREVAHRMKRIFWHRVPSTANAQLGRVHEDRLGSGLFVPNQLRPHAKSRG